MPSVIVASAIVAIGVGLTAGASPRLRIEERIAVGAVLGVVAVNVTMFLSFLVMGMGWRTLLVGLVVPATGAVIAARRRAGQFRKEVAWGRRRLCQPASRPTSLRPFVAVVAASAAVSTRVLSLSYQTTPDGVSVGSLAVWGDWSAHLAYAASFAYGDNRALDLPIATGTAFRYHFLADFFGALFTVSGSTLPQSMALSAWILAAVLPALLWCTVIRLSRSRATAALTLVLFALSGGLGFFYFLRDLFERGWGTLGSLPHSYARMPQHHLWLDNTISASLYAQRSTLLGLCVGLAAAVLLLAARPGWRRRSFLVAGLLVGVLGIGHAHTLFTALALASMAWAVDRRGTWWWFLGPAAVIGLPLALAIAPPANTTRLLVGWMAPASGQLWPWFWLRNAGLFLPLFAGVSLLGGGLPRLRRVTAPLWLWFAVPNVLAFHPWEWNNTKFFLFWQLAGSLLVASWITRMWSSAASRRARSRRFALRAVSLTSVVLLVSVGALDTIRAMQRSTAIPWVEGDEVAAAEWLRRHSDPDEVLVYGAHNVSAVAALSGRRAVSGYPGWTSDLGLPDWGDRWKDSDAILAGAATAHAAIERYGVDVILVGPRERTESSASDAYWSRHGTLVFERGSYRIYRVG